MSTSPKGKQEKRRDRREERRVKREAELRVAQRRRLLLISGAVAALVVVGIVAFFALRGASTSSAANNQSATNSQATVDPTATAIAAMPPAGVSSIACNSSEQLTYHVHAHVSLYINGQPAQIPADIGIDNNQGCIYWLHTHDTSGVIHVEAPQPANYTLGAFLDLWKEKFAQLGYDQQLDQAGGWKVYINGKPYNGDFRNISLISHTLITMAYNSPNITPDAAYNWDGL